MNNKSIKIVLFILLIILLLIVFFLSLLGTSLSLDSIDNIKKDRKESTYNKDIKINGIKMVYDKDNNIYYLSLPNKKSNELYILKLDIAGYKYRLVNKNSNIIKIDYKKTYKLILYNNKNYSTINIRITNLPILNINSQDSITDNKVKGNLSYISSNGSIDENIKIKVRGNTSRWYNKKSYKIYVYNKNYSKEKKIALSNFEPLDSFILDANYRDSSKIRNGIAFDLWSLFNDDFTSIDIKYENVEVFINGVYNGLYMLITPVKRQTLNLNKTSDNDTSIIIKEDNRDHSKTGSYSDVDEENRDNFIIKYPNDTNWYKKVWKKSLNILEKYYNDNTYNSYEIVKNTFNITNYVDLVLFNSFISNNDNSLSKNNYIYMNSMNDDVFYIQPWDMEFSMGFHWCDKCTRNSRLDKDDYKSIDVKIDKESDEIKKLIIKRYKYLRKYVLTKSNINKLIDTRMNEIKYASIRDSEKWYEYDVEKEIDIVRNWLLKRLNIYDKYIEDIANEL